MTDLPAGPRRYNENEVSRLLKRATELQKSRATSPDPSGLTLAELEEVALEAGIDPGLLRRAAEELDTDTGPLEGWGPKLAGAPTRVLLERTLPFEAPESVFAQLVPTIQIAADSPGQASQVGRALTWHSQNPQNPRTLQVIVTVQTAQTLIRIEERYGGLAGAIFGGVMGGVGGGVGMGLGGALGGLLGSAALAVAFPVGVIGASYLISRKAFSTAVRKRGRRLRQLLDSLEEQLRMAAEADGAGKTLPPGPGA